MTPHVSLWLPFNALSDGTLFDRFKACAGDWAVRWFPKSECATFRQRVSYADERPPIGQVGWETADGGITLAIDRTGRLKLASSMLGLPFAPYKLTESDAELLIELADACLQDLLRTSAEVLFVKADIRRLSPYAVRASAISTVQFGISKGQGAALLSLHVRQDTAISARKAAVPHEPSRPNLVSREDAVSRQPIRVSARVGTGTITLEELSSLAYGDVLVLDRGVADRLELVINGKLQPGAICELGRDQSTLNLRVVELQNGDRS